MRPSNLSIPWRIALIAGLAAVLGRTLWLVGNVQAGTFGSEPAWVTNSLGVAWLIGIVLIVVALLKSRRGAGNSQSIDGAGRSTSFRPRVPAAFEWTLWLYLPFTTFGALVIGLFLNLGWLLTGLLVTVLILGWPVFLTVLAVRYEITEDALVIRQVGRKVAIKWGDVAEVAMVRVPFAQQVLITTIDGRKERLGTPDDRDRFLRALADHAPAARFE